MPSLPAARQSTERLRETALPPISRKGQQTNNSPAFPGSTGASPAALPGQRTSDPSPAPCSALPTNRGSDSSPEHQPPAPGAHITTAQPSPLPASPRFLGARASRLQQSQETHQPGLDLCPLPGSPSAGERQLPRTPTACARRPHHNRSAQPLPARPRFLGARASRLRLSQTSAPAIPHAPHATAFPTNLLHPPGCSNGRNRISQSGVLAEPEW